MKGKIVLIAFLIFITTTKCSQVSDRNTSTNPLPTISVEVSTYQPNEQPAQSTHTPIVTLVPAQVVTPSIAVALTSTVDGSHSDTRLLSGFPTPIPNQGVQQTCLIIQNITPTVNSMEGVLVLAPSQESMQNEFFYLQNLQTGERLQISSLGLDNAISPDHRWFAFSDYHSGNLHVMSADGVEQQISSWRQGLGYIVAWLDNQRILLAPRYPETQQQNYGVMNVYNPFDGEIQVIDITLPARINADPIHWYPHASIPIIMYDSTLTRGVYLSYEEGLILLDVQTQQVLWDMVDITFLNRPAWKLDGSGFSIGGSEELWPEEIGNIYIVDRDGTETRLTHLSDALATQSVYATMISWSPDETMIAFWLTVGEYYTRYVHLAVLEVSTGEVIDFCIPGTNILYPVWSPDSRQLAVFSLLTSDDGFNGTVIVDLDTEQAFQLADGLIPIGWMITP